MKLKIVDNIPLPENWNVAGVRGNSGYSTMLREMKIGQSFEFTVSNAENEKELRNLRQAIYNLQKARLGRRNFVVRLIDKNDELGIKVYRIWAAPLGIVTEK